MDRARKLIDLTQGREQTPNCMLHPQETVGKLLGCRMLQAASSDSVHITGSPIFCRPTDTQEGQYVYTEDSRKQWLTAFGVQRSRLPDGKAEGDLVHEVSKVVHQVESRVVDTAQQISEEVAERVDGPTN